MKKTVVLFAGLILVVATLFGCGGKTPTPPEPSGTVAPPDTGISEDLYDENGYLKDSIPSGLNYGGETVRVMGWKNSEALYDFSVDFSGGDEIAEQTFSRNNLVQERLKINLEFDLSYDGGNADRAEYISRVENTLRSGYTFDLIACYSQCAANFSADGFLRDLNEYDGILDFSKPWWSSSLQAGSSINGKLYFASGSISATSILQTFVLSVNMVKINANQELTDPRELALDGDWTMEEFYRICRNAYLDTNADITGKDAGDTFGYISMDSVVGDAFLASNGLKYLSTDEEGKLVLAPEFRGSKIYDLSRDLIACFKSDDYYYPTAYSFDIFAEGRAIFAGTSFSVLMQNRNKISDRYGYLPFPKADTDQLQYYSTSGFPYSMWSMTTYCENTERAAYVMEALASGGYRTVQPKVYDLLKYRGQDDPINAQMFDLIISSKTYDMGRIFHNEFEWEDSPVALFRTRLYKTASDDWYSALDGKTTAMQNVIDRINARFGY